MLEREGEFAGNGRVERRELSKLYHLLFVVKLFLWQRKLVVVIINPLMTFYLCGVGVQFV